MEDIKPLLKANGYTQKEIEKISSYYEYAVTNNIPYPYYYAISKLAV